MPEKFQFFDGKRFTRDDKTGYYLCATADDGKRKRMHVYVWEYFNGPVPKGYHIHHIDGDKSNNNIKNLQLLLAMEHEKLHGSMWTDEQRNRARKNIEKASNVYNMEVKSHHNFSVCQMKASEGMSVVWLWNSSSWAWKTSQRSRPDIIKKV